jgi:hypothetical protein
MSNLTRPEIEIALKILSGMKEENPLLYAQLQRLLPALATDFAKAGKPVDEVILKTMLVNAIDNGEPLHSLFSQPARHKSRLTYQDVGRRLNARMDYRYSTSIEDSIKFGHVDDVRRHAEATPFSEGFMSMNIVHAASHGHYDIVKFFIETAKNKNLLIKIAISNAISNYRPKFNVLDGLIADFGDHTSTIQEAVGFSLKTPARADYARYSEIKEKLQRQGNLPADCFVGLEEWSVASVKMGEYIKIREMLAHEVPYLHLRNQAAYKAAMIFQSAERVLRYTDKWGSYSKSPMKSAIDELQAPYVSKGVHWREWGDALLKFGPQMGFMLNYIEQVPRPLYNDKGEISLRLTRDHIWKTCYPKKQLDMDLAGLCFRLERTNAHFELALNTWRDRKRDDATLTMTVPDITIDGASFGLPGYTLKRMSYDDQRVMFLGDFTGCCERIGYTFEETVFHTLETRESGYYVLMEGDDIRLHTWAWRGEGGQLVIDGYETDDSTITDEHLVAITQAIADEVGNPAYKDHVLTDVILGISNTDFKPQSFFPLANDMVERRVLEWYFPEENQWLVKRFAPPTHSVPLPVKEEAPKLQLG